MADLSDDELAHALTAGVADSWWPARAAVGLLVAHRRWLSRGELRGAVETHVTPEGELLAWIGWEQVDVANAAASAGEVRLLTLACSLGGVPSERPLCDLLSSLDSLNTFRVLDAVSMACSGRLLGGRQLS